MEWINEFDQRLRHFEADAPPGAGQFSISIKVKVDSGCYGRGCCPWAYKIIDREVLSLRKERFHFEEHESGPEILTVVADALTIAANIAVLVTLIIQARAEGRRHGDRHNDPVTLIVRRTENRDQLIEERLMTFNGGEDVTCEMIQRLLHSGIKKIAPKNQKHSKPSTRRRKSDY